MKEEDVKKIKVGDWIMYTIGSVVHVDEVIREPAKDEEVWLGLDTGYYVTTRRHNIHASQVKEVRRG